MRRLVPDPGETTVELQLGDYRPWEEASGDRPHVAMNFAATLDGRATIEGRSGQIGSDTDTAMLVGLRGRFDAVMIGAGTMRAERYGRISSSEQRRSERQALGLSADPLVVIISGRLDLPWDAPLFTQGGKVVVFTAAEDEEPPPTAATIEVVRHEGQVELDAALAHLRREHGIQTLLCEGGPRLHSQLWSLGLVDELFLTMAPKLTGAGPSILEGELAPPAQLELAWLLEEGGELFGRYRRSVPID